ncbi:GntR family phosphonate transport system transcriptional regulator [Rhodoligotrophos appendicifer]|uniref:phosphonate metabolism transcriptional regulator PhnF n=1 Tax=Rhodoligotrophos appendicifer TaxID=987056 RepID=UPI00147829BB|nr:phosphonate metabolism transcriptional regulator PhnF [Rhodoligotrophos appendicifer]
MRRAGVVLWRQIEKEIERDIDAGLFASGSRLPVESELATRFGVNRHTVRQALAALQERGRIRIQQGRGMFVHRPMIDYPIGPGTRFSANIERQRMTSSGRLVDASTIAASRQLAEDLALDVGAPCLVINDLREIDGVPVAISSRHFPAARFTGLDLCFEKTGSISQALAAFGVHEFHRTWSRIHAEHCAVADSAMLRLPSGAPVLVVESLNVDAKGTPIEYDVSRSVGGAFQLLIDHTTPS